MSLIDFIEKLQKKPRYVRIRIMWTGAIMIMAVIFVFWLWSLAVLLSQPLDANKKEEKALQGLVEIKKEMPGLWESFSAGIGNIIDTTKDGLSGDSNPAPSSSGQPQIERLPIEQ